MTDHKILITGGAGLIGSHLAEKCLLEGHRVTILDNLSTGLLANVAPLLERFPGQLTFIEDSVENQALIQKLVSEHDAIYHLASVVGVKRVLQEPLTTILEGLRGTLNILQAAAIYNRKALVASTSEVYGRAQELILSQELPALSEISFLVLGSPAKHRWIYAITKLAKEALAIAYHREKACPFVVVRFFNTVGPRQSAAYGMVIPSMVRAALAGQPIPVYGTGQQKRSFLHVSDAVEAIYRLLFEAPTPPWGEIFNVGNPQETSILALAQRIQALTGTNSSIELIPYEKAYGPGFEDMQKRTPDITKIKTWLGWQPKKQLDDILQETIAYYRALEPSLK